MSLAGFLESLNNAMREGKGLKREMVEVKDATPLALVEGGGSRLPRLRSRPSTLGLMGNSTPPRPHAYCCNVEGL
jgi:hypothetical protein